MPENILPTDLSNSPTPVANPFMPATPTEYQPTPVGVEEQYKNPLEGMNLSQILGSVQKPVKNDSLGGVFTQGDMSRYPQYNPYRDNEESYAQSQSWNSKWGNALVKTGATAFTAFSEGMLAIPDMINGISGGNVYKGETAQNLDNWKNNLENSFPNYYTKWETEHPFVSAIPFSGGGANFWSDKFVKNIGFTIGAIGAAVAQDAAIGAVTEGIGELPLVANQVGKAALWMNKILSGANDVEKVLQEAYELKKTAGAIGNASFDVWKASDETAISLKSLAQIAKGQKLMSGVRQAITTVGASHTEAAMEGREGYNNLKKTLTDEYLAKNGYNPTGDDLARIEDVATSAGNVRYGTNLAILTVSNALQFDAIFKPFNSYKNALKTGIEASIEGQEGKIVTTAEKIATSGDIDNLAIKQVGKADKAWGLIKKVLPNIFTEGVFEEGGQFATDKATENYFKNKYNNSHKDSLTDIINSTVYGLKQQFGTTEGLENMFIGGLTGILTEPIMHKVGEARKQRAGYATTQEATSQALSTLNSQGVTGLFEQNYDNAADNIKLKKDISSAIKDNNVFTFKNLKAKAFYDFIKSGIDSSRHEVRIEQLNMLKDLPNEEFNKLFGIEEKDRPNAVEYVDKLIAKANEIKVSSDRISGLFQNPFSYRANAASIKDENKQKEALEQNNNYLGFEEYKKALGLYAYQVKDYNSRKADIASSLSEVHPAITTDMAAMVASPDGLGMLANEYEQKATDIQEQLADKDTIRTKEEKKALKEQYKTLATLSREIKDVVGADSYKQDALAALHNKLINFEISGQTSDASVIGKELSPDLIEKGHDLNRIKQATQVASISYDHIFSQDGYEDFMKDWGTWKEGLNNYDYTDIYNNRDRKSDINTPSGDFISGRSYEAPKGRISSDLDTVETIRYTDMGMVEVRDNKGNIQYIKPSTLKGYKLIASEEEVLENDEDLKKNISDFGNALSNESSAIATGNPDEDAAIIAQERINSGEAKKNIFQATGISSTNGSVYDQTVEYNRAQREQSFHEALVKNPTLRGQLKVIPITYNNQAEYGFDFIEPTYTKSGEVIDNASNPTKGKITLVFVKDNQDGTYTTLDKDGAELSVIGKDNKQDPNKFVFNVLENADRTRINKRNAENKEETKYHFFKEDRDEAGNRVEYTDEEVEDIISQAEKLRAKTFNNKELQVFDFSVSKGFENTEGKARNSVIDAGLINQEDLSNGLIIEIPTVEGVGILNKYFVPLGRPVLNRGTDFQILDNTFIRDNQANSVYTTLLYTAQEFFKGAKTTPAGVIDYINSVVYTRKGGDFYISGNEIFVGKDKISLTPKAVEENKDKIIAHLKTLYHNINNKTLGKGNGKQETYYEPIGIEDGKLTYRNWKSYQHYLLSPIYDITDNTEEQGKPRTEIPLTTKIKQKSMYPSGVEVTPMVGKYITLKDYNEYVPSVPVKEKGVAPKPIEANKDIKDKSVVTIPSNQFYEGGDFIFDGKTMNTLTMTNGEKYVFSAEAGENKETVVAINTPESNIGDMGQMFGSPEALISTLLQDYIYPTDEMAVEVGEPIIVETQEELIDDDAAFAVFLKEAKATSITGDLDESYRKIGKDEQIDEIWDEKEFKSYMAENLPQFNPNSLENVIKTSDGGYAWGAQRDKYIYIYKNAPNGTQYHEAFEGVYNSFLSEKEQQDVLAEFKKRAGSFIDNETGEEIKYSSATDSQAKERIADEFGEFKTKGVIFKGEGKKMSFFRRLLDFLKILFTTPDLQIQQLFNRIDTAFYKEHSFNGNLTTTAYSKIRKNTPVLESWINDTMHQMSFYLRAEMLKRGKFVDLAEGKVSKSEAYNILFPIMKTYYQKITLSDAIPLAVRKRLIIGDNTGFKGWKYIENNWTDFVDENVQFNKAMGMNFPNGEYSFDLDQALTQYNNEQIQDATLSDESFVQKEENKNRNEYERDITTIDSWGTVSNAVKLLFNTVTESTYPKASNPTLERPEPVLSSVGGRKLVQGNGLYYTVQNSLKGSKDVQEMQDRLRKLATKNPNVVGIYNILFSSDKESMTSDQQKLLVQFMNAMNVQSPDVFIQTTNENGETRIIDANSSFLSRRIVEDWSNEIKAKNYKINNTGLVVRSEDNTYVIDSKRIKSTVGDVEGQISFLKEISFPFTKSSFNKLSADEQSEFSKQVKTIYSLFKANEFVNTTKLADVNGPFKSLAYLKAIAEGDDSTGTQTNISNNTTQSNIQQNHLSKTNNIINGSSSRGNLLSVYPALNNPYTTNSVLLSIDNWKNGKRISPLNTSYTEGGKNQNDDVVTLDKADLGMRLLFEINSNLRGSFYSLVGADAKMEWATNFNDSMDSPGHYITFNDFKNDGAWQEKMNGIFKGYFEDEMALIRQFSQGVGVDNENIAVRDGENKDGKAAGEKLRFFKGLFDYKFQNSVEEYAKGVENLSEFVAENSSAINKAVEKFINEQVQRQVNFLIQNNILIGTDNALTIQGIDTDMLGKLGYTNDKLTPDQARNVITFRTVNYVINNTEVHKLYFGDPAQYKDSNKRIKSYESGRYPIYTGDEAFNTQAKALFNNVNGVTVPSTVPGYVGFGEEYVALTFDWGDAEDKSTRVVSEQINDIPEEIRPEYEKINEVDAQAYRIAPSVLQQSWRTGDLSKDQQALLAYDGAKARMDLFARGEFTEYNPELQKADVLLVAKGKPKAILPIRKPITAGVISRKGMMESHLYKNSEMPLLWSNLDAYPKLQELYIWMWKNGVDQIGPKSQHKVGAPAIIPALYNTATGSLNLEAMTAAINNGVGRSIPWMIHGKQVETAGEHKGQTIITQLQAIFQQDKYIQGKPNDYNGTLEGWNKLSKEEKIGSSKMFELSSRNTAARAELTSLGYNNLLNRLGITEGQNGEFATVDGLKLAEFLKTELTRREIDANTLSAIEPIYNELTGNYDLSTPLEALNKYKVIKEMIWAVADREMVHTKLNGGQKIQISGAMWEDNNREGVYKRGNRWVKVEDYNALTKEEKATVRLTSSKYKFYSYKKGDKQINAMEVAIPCHFRDKIKQSAKLRNYTDAQLIDYLNTEEGRDILTGVGARIPVQGMNSVEAFIIKEFLPDSMGDAIVVPSEITVKAGSDFDVDKLNTYLKNIYVDSNGDLKTVPTFSSIEEVKKLYTENALKSMLINDISINDDVHHTILANGLDNLDIDFEEEQKADEKAIATLYRQGLENEYFRTMEEMILLPDNYVRLLAPNSTTGIEATAAKIDALHKAGKSKEDIINYAAKGDISYIDLFSPMGMARTRHMFMITKSDVGTAASNVKLFTQLQAGNVYMEGSLRLPHNTFNENGKKYISLSRQQNTEGKYISDELSQDTNAIVDVAKNPYYPIMVGFSALIGPSIYLQGVGVPQEYVYMFMNQPIVRDYMLEKAKDKMQRTLNPDFKVRGQKALKESLLRKYSIDPSKKVEATVNQFTLQDLEEGISKPNIKEHRELQYFVLDEFFNIQEQADNVFKLSEGLKWDTAKFRSGSWVEIKERQYQEALNTGIYGVEELVNNSIVGAIREKVNNSRNSLTSIFKLETPVVDALIFNSKEQIMGKRISADKKIALLQKLELSLLNYSLLNSVEVEGKPLNKWIGKLLVGDNNIAKQFADVLEIVNSKPNSDLAKNPALLALAPVMKNNVAGTKNMAITKRPSGTYEQNLLTGSIRELLQNPITSEFAKNLVLAGMIQSGLSSSRISYNTLLPTEQYSPFIKQALQAVNNDGINKTPFRSLNVFERTNWQDRNVVPVVNKFVYPSDDRLKSIRKNGDSFITLPTSSMDSVVRITGTAINPITGQEFTGLDKKRMAANNDYSFSVSKIYQRVGEFSFVQDTANGRGAGTEQVALYKQINAWGDGMYLTEMYDVPQPSILSTNQRVEEVRDEDIFGALGNRLVKKEVVPTYKEELPSDNDDYENALENKRSIEDQLIDLQNQIDAQNSIDNSNNPYIYIADQLPKITPTSAKKETGGTVNKDINMGMLDAKGVSVEKAAELLAEEMESTGVQLLSEDSIRNEIIDLLLTGKKNYIEKNTKSSKVAELEEEMKQLQNSLKNAEMLINEATPLSIQQEIGKQSAMFQIEDFESYKENFKKKGC